MREPRLHHASDDVPGISRRRSGKGVAYYDTNGSLIKDGAVKQRVKALAIPPAWTDVWICPDPLGHIQVTGRDARGRKQYIYHSDFRAWREATKFEHVIAFAEALPALRESVKRDLARRTLDRELVVATAIRVMDQTLMRVGNTAYAEHNNTYGLTTLKEKHVTLNGGSEVRFTFRGKGGKPYKAKMSDRRVAAILRRLEDLGGQHLFEYVDEQGEARPITSDDVNAYIREATGGDFSAKDFRTWAATVLATLELVQCEIGETQKMTRSLVKHALENVARQLGNTVTVCRKSYVHPEVIESYLDGTLAKICASEVDKATDETPAGLTSDEATVLAFLKRRAAASRPSRKAA